MKITMQNTLCIFLAWLIALSVFADRAAKQIGQDGAENEVDVRCSLVNLLGFDVRGFTLGDDTTQESARKRESLGKPSPQAVERQLLFPHLGGERWYPRA